MSYTYPEKLQAFDDMLATPTLTAEEKYWVEKMKELLVQGVFHDTWARLEAQNPPRGQHRPHRRPQGSNPSENNA